MATKQYKASTNWDLEIQDALDRYPLDDSLSPINLNEKFFARADDRKAQIQIMAMMLKHKNRQQYDHLKNHGGEIDSNALVKYAKEKESQLFRPWGDNGLLSGVYESAFNFAIQTDLTNMLNAWRAYARNFFAALDTASDTLKRVLDADKDQRVQSYQFKKAMIGSAFNLIAGAFLLSPVTSLLGSAIDGILNTRGPSAFADTPSVDSSNNMKYTPPQLKDINVSTAVRNEGLAAVLKAGPTALLSTATAGLDYKQPGFIEKHFGNKLLPPLNNEEFTTFSKRVWTLFDDLIESILNSLKKLFIQFTHPGWNQRFTIRFLINAQKKNKLTERHMEQPFEFIRNSIVHLCRDKLTEALLTQYQCPKSTSFDSITLQRFLLAQYLLAYDKAKSIKGNTLALEMGQSLRQYLLDLGVAEKRPYSDWYHGDKAKELRKAEVEAMVDSVKNPPKSNQQQLLRLGMYTSKKNDMEDAIKWAKAYPGTDEIKRVLALPTFKETGEGTPPK